MIPYVVWKVLYWWPAENRGDAANFILCHCDCLSMYCNAWLRVALEDRHHLPPAHIGGDGTGWIEGDGEKVMEENVMVMVFNQINSLRGL